MANKKIILTGDRPTGRLHLGHYVVGVSPVNRLQDALAALHEVKKETFCPKDVWILVNE